MMVKKSGSFLLELIFDDDNAGVASAASSIITTTSLSTHTNTAARPSPENFKKTLDY